MSGFSVQPQRRSLRLPGYNYSSSGMYFLTICTGKRAALFGRVDKGKMVENVCGQIVRSCWEELAFRVEHIQTDAFVIMPNHIHGILVILGNAAIKPDVGAIHELPLQPTRARRQMLLPKVIGRFKMNSSKCINKLRHTSGSSVWQRNYYEHVIRNDEALTRIRGYIQTNPLRWELDRENPERCGTDDFDRWLWKEGGINHGTGTE